MTFDPDRMKENHRAAKASDLSYVDDWPCTGPLCSRHVWCAVHNRWAEPKQDSKRPQQPEPAAPAGDVLDF